QRLASMGVPVFAARLDDAGNPDRSDKLWLRWQSKRPDPEAVLRWKPGDALCAVTGVLFDVLDWDPRNDPGEESWNALSDALGEDGPFVFWEVATPRGGRHFYVAGMGIGSHNGFMPGLDLKGGKEDGTGRGFVFIPPTQRMGGTYRPTSLLQPYGDNNHISGLRTYIEDRLAASLDGAASEGRRGRQSPDKIRREVLSAPDGEQRPALLRLVSEYEKRGHTREDIKDILRGLLPSVRAYDRSDPWYPAKGRNPDYW